MGGVKCGDSLQAKQPISSFPPFLTLLAKVVRAFLETYFILSDFSDLECGGNSFQAKQFSSFLCAIGKGRGCFFIY